MPEQPVGPHCGNNPNAQLTPGDRKAVDDFKARLALQASAKPYIDRAVWVDGDPLMEVIAVTVWERCARDDEDMPQLVCDDPRTIAAFAAAVARAHAVLPAPVDRAAILREAADIAESLRQFESATGARKSAQVSENVGILRVAAELRRVAYERTTGHAITCLAVAGGGSDPDCPACQTDPGRMADEAQQPERTPCSDPPCDNGPGEPCDRHETEQAHADGLHEDCGPTCEVQFPSEQMRNFILAKGYPGTAGMLDELLRRAAAGQLPAVEAQQTETQAPPWKCAHCGQPITSDGPGYDWAGPVPWPGEPQQRFHIALEYPECRAASGTFGPAAVSQPSKEA